MRSLAIVFLVACGQAPRPVAVPTPAGIDWPAGLDHESTDATRAAAALDVVELSGMRVAMDAALEVTLRQQMTANPKIRPYEAIMREFLSRYVTYEALRGDFVKLFASNFTELQLRQMAAFYRTPTGRAAVGAQAHLIETGAKLGASRVQEHMAELVDMIKRAPASGEP
jgi:uncharacterized protein